MFLSDELLQLGLAANPKNNLSQSNQGEKMLDLLNAKNNTGVDAIKLINIKHSLLPQHIQAQLPEHKNNVQMRNSDGYWQFIPDPQNNNIHIIYQMHGDAGVTLPVEWTHFGIINSAFVTLSNLRKHFIQAR